MYMTNPGAAGMICMASMVLALGFICATFSVEGKHWAHETRGTTTSTDDITAFHELLFSKENTNGFAARKLMDLGDEDEEENGGWMNRIGETCSKGNVVISQGPTNPLPNGIPTYTVQIVNGCATGCSVSDIHLSCGWFSSASQIDPRLFKRIAYDDCLVNDGQPMLPGEALSFIYANTFAYPLSVSSLSCSD
ncbi:TPD1 protein homolog 1-like [Diospyros lotus]|uniref:TPD1 protein homolog 1-like n=1 Tax=Diospyros lotus TaxID=55363 RepID=UPI0022557115|nr:TPD1 protein homolog 1-like [Diospyros lotus]